MLLKKLLFSLCLSPLILYDTDGLVYQFSFFLGASGKNGLYLPLSYDGITFFSDTRIIEQFVYVLKPDIRAIDHVFALTGSVDPA